MPLVIKKTKGMFKVCENEPKGKCYSKKPLTKQVAMKQKIAITLSKLRKKGKILPRK